MFDGLLTNQIRGDPDIAGMLARYKGKPAFFYQKSPQDDDRGWENPKYPRVDYNLDIRYDPERKAGGILMINVLCSAESAAMPEDIEKRLVELINGTFYTNRERATICAVWNRSDAFQYANPATVAETVIPDILGVSITFDLLQFPEQITTDPDPIQALNLWTRYYFPGMTIIAHDEMPPIYKPSDANPAIYWRFEGAATNDKQTFAVNWYTGAFAAHVIAGSITERNRWTRAIMEQIQLDGEVLLLDGSPMFAKQITIRHSADPLREGQFQLTGQYGVLTQHRKERSVERLRMDAIPNRERTSAYLPEHRRRQYEPHIPKEQRDFVDAAQHVLNNAIYPNIGMEVKADGKKPE